jgi:hypothetical protein
MPRASLNNKLNVKKQGMKTEQDYGYKEWEDWFKAVEDGHGGTDLNVLQLDDVSEHGHRAVRHERLHIFLRQRCATISTFFFFEVHNRERETVAYLRGQRRRRRDPFAASARARPRSARCGNAPSTAQISGNSSRKKKGKFLKKDAYLVRSDGELLDVEF